LDPLAEHAFKPEFFEVLPPRQFHSRDGRVKDDNPRGAQSFHRVIYKRIENRDHVRVPRIPSVLSERMSND
jgi:hypothetical protein